MSLSPEQITIAITVYNRRQYIKQAVASALNQSVPVQVIVVEDCGPDVGLESYVTNQFGPKIKYIRNLKRRGLFGNWNACLEMCRTEWITILHDDDYLSPDYVKGMIDLERQAPGHSLYLGQSCVVDDAGQPISVQDDRTVTGNYTERGLADILFMPFFFPGHLFRVRDALNLGGFRVTSLYCGDWEMWAKLMAIAGAAQSAQTLAFVRDHGGMEKGTNKVVREGRQYPTSIVQHKRILNLLPQESARSFDRGRYMKRFPLPTRFLLRYGAALSPRLLRYHLALLELSDPPHLGYNVFKQMARLGGEPFVRITSALWNRMQRG